MKKAAAGLLMLSVLAVLSLSAAKYRVNYFLTGNGSSKFLLFFSFRFYYETAGSLEFESHPDSRGELMVFHCLPEENYVMRTMNFSGSSLALATVFPAGARPDDFVRKKFGDPYYVRLKSASNIKKKRFAHFSYYNSAPGAAAFRFHRSLVGAVSGVENKLQKKPHDINKELKVTFNPFQMTEVLLSFYEAPFLPREREYTDTLLFRSSWQSDEIDLTKKITKLSGTIEKIVEKYVKAKQGKPLRLDYSSSGLRPDMTIEVCGQLHDNVFFWKDFRIEQFKRVLHFELLDGCCPALIRDKIFMEIRNNENQQGFGFIEIERIRSQDE